MKHYDTVLVTGASRGLGAALGRVLVDRGYRVLLAARSAHDLDAVAAPLRERAGDRVAIATVDLARRDAVDALVAHARATFGTIDVLINNAGIGAYKPLVDWTADEIVACIDVNLTAPLLLSHALAPAMIARRRGMIVNVASDLARRYLANMTPYVASKFGMLGFGGSLLRELKAANVKVTTVMPGIIDTAFGGASEGSKEETWALRPKHLAERIVDLLELPEHLVIDEMTVHPMQQDF